MRRVWQGVGCGSTVQGVGRVCFRQRHSVIHRPGVGIRGSGRRHVGIERLVGCGYRHVGALGKPVELVVGAVDLAHEVVDAVTVLGPY